MACTLDAASDNDFMCHRRTMLAALLCSSSAVPAAAPEVVFKTAAETGVQHKFGLAGARLPGFCIEYLRALIAHDSGLHFEGLAQYLPVLRIERELGAGAMDVFFGLLKTPDRLERFRFIDQPALYVSRHRVAVRADDSEVDSVQGFDDIRALGDHGIVLATRGTAYASYLQRQPGVRVDDGATDHLQNLRKLVRGRGRFFYQSESVIKQLIQSDGLHDKVRMLPAVFAAEPLLVAHSATLDATRLARLSAAMSDLETNGTAAKLRAAYGL